MNLTDTLNSFEKYLDLVPDILLPYAEQDDIGGFHPDPSQRKWGIGAIFAVEGKILYALIRALKPQTIVEVGSGTGCSTTHMASALLDNGGSGHITTIDRGNTPHVPSDLQDFVTIESGDAINILALMPDHSIDFLLEDADHSEALCAAIGELAKTKLKPGGVMIAHDAAHFGVGRDVCMGFDRAGLDYRVYLTEPSDCGWLVWRAPKAVMRMLTPDELIQGVKEVHAAIDSGELTLTDFTVLQAQEEPNATATTPAPKKSRKKAAK